ncbi:anti-sigma factor [Puia dinghuensis]|uniref:Anti-sigma factor n=2 Tax=Puia dinghuensis TaxID=1792502 RepID=A0A8J2XSU3_9BACT|nr:anti-sigma factor [Puia dinghuensis]
MSRRLSGESTPEEEEELQQLLQRSPDKGYSFDVLQGYFSSPPDSASDSIEEEDPDLEARFRRIIDMPDGDKRAQRKRIIRFSPRGAIGYAASVAALIVLGWGIYRLLPEHKIALPAIRPVGNEEVQARPGARTRLLLPDGTQVWLNSNSKLKYTGDFNIGSREVGLEGEACFDVTKDMEHPFIVHASTLDIKVLGTSFTVRSYPQDETVEAAVLKGVIEVSRKGSPNTARIILRPNEKLVLNKLPAPSVAAAGKAATGMAISHIRPDIPDSEKVETSWMYNRLVFDGDNFRELANKMERWYDVHIMVKDARLNQYHFGGVFANESIEEALKELQLTANFTYKINGKEIELYAKQ